MAEEWVENLAVELRREMKARKLSQRKAAKFTGLSLSTIGDILGAVTTPRMSSIRQLAKAFGWGDDVFRSLMQNEIVPIEDVQRQRAMALFDQLSADRQEDVIDLLSLWVERERKG